MEWVACGRAVQDLEGHSLYGLGSGICFAQQVSYLMDGCGKYVRVIGLLYYLNG